MKNKFFCFLIGIVSSLIIIELPLHIFYGSPHKHLQKNVSTNTYYYEIEPFKKFFKKEKTSKGLMYVKQKSSPRNFFVNKSTNTKRIFILGESIAEQFGNSYEQLEMLFKSQLPQYNFEVINCGQGGYESTRILLSFYQIVNYSPDLIIVMMGNNIVQDPLKFNNFTMFLYLNSWYYYTIKNIILKKQKDFSHKERKKLYYKNILKMLNVCNKKNIPIIISTVPIKIKDNPHGKFLLFNKNFFLGKIAFESANIIQAKKFFTKLLNSTEISNKSTVYYYLGQIYEKEKNYNLAKEYYLSSMNYLPYQFEFNNFIKNLFKYNKNNIYLLLDLEKIFQVLSPVKISGNNIFYDSCHWYAPWNELVNYEIIKHIYLHNKNYQTNIIAPINEWNFSLTEPNIENIENNILILKSNKDFFVDYNLFGICETFLKYITKSKNTKNFYDYFNNFMPPKVSYPYLCIIKNSISIEELKKILSTIYLKTISEYFPPEKFSPKNLSKEKVIAIILYYLAEEFRINKKYSLAITYFTESIKIDPNNIYAYLLRGLAYYNIKNYKKAKDDWLKVIKKDKEFTWLLELL